MEPLIYKRGEIYLANLDPVIGSEQGGIRPVLIVQNNTGNRFSPTVIVAVITTKRNPHQPTHVKLGAQFGLPEDSILEAEQTRTLDKTRLQYRLGQVSRDIMREIDHALKVSLALLDNEPNRIVLCPRCAAAFYESSAYYIKRVDQYQTVRAKCDYCNMHFGYDYWLTDRKKQNRG